MFHKESCNQYDNKHGYCLDNDMCEAEKKSCCFNCHLNESCDDQALCSNYKVSDAWDSLWPGNKSGTDMIDEMLNGFMRKAISQYCKKYRVNHDACGVCGIPCVINDRADTCCFTCSLSYNIEGVRCGSTCATFTAHSATYIDIPKDMTREKALSILQRGYGCDLADNNKCYKSDKCKANCTERHDIYSKCCFSCGINDCFNHPDQEEEEDMSCALSKKCSHCDLCLSNCPTDVPNSNYPSDNCCYTCGVTECRLYPTQADFEEHEYMKEGVNCNYRDTCEHVGYCLNDCDSRNDLNRKCCFTCNHPDCRCSIAGVARPDMVMSQDVVVKNGKIPQPPNEYPQCGICGVNFFSTKGLDKHLQNDHINPHDSKNIKITMEGGIDMINRYDTGESQKFFSDEIEISLQYRKDNKDDAVYVNNKVVAKATGITDVVKIITRELADVLTQKTYNIRVFVKYNTIRNSYYTITINHETVGISLQAAVGYPYNDYYSKTHSKNNLAKMLEAGLKLGSYDDMLKSDQEVAKLEEKITKSRDKASEKVKNLIQDAHGEKGLRED